MIEAPRRRRIAKKRILCAELHNQGLTKRQIAQRTGISEIGVTAHLKILRRNGDIPPLELLDNENSMKSKFKNKGVPIGSVGKMLTSLDPKVVDWLVAQTPQGAMAVEFVASIITDAYNEENPDV
jgi:hypothetical protein